MRKYYYKDASGQHGPLPLEKLKGKGITAETPVWYDPLPQWTTAGQVDELKVLFTPITPDQPTAVVTQTPVAEMPKAEKPPVETPITPGVAVTTTPAAKTPVAAASTTTVKTRPAQEKSTAWVSWVLSLLVLGGVGYYIYQDMEKNKDQTLNSTELSMTENNADASNAQSVASTADTAASPIVTTAPSADTTVSFTTTTDPAVTASTTTATTEQDKKALAKKKAEEDKKKQATLARQKADELKKQQLAAEAALAKELQVRNNWSKYITTGSLNYQPKGDDGMTAFDVPVYNGTDAVLNKVTIRIDYYKKEKKDKIVHTETVVLNNIPPKSALNGKGPENKKARKAVVTITGISSKNLHFCYPQGSGKSGDPYYCN